MSGGFRKILILITVLFCSTTVSAQSITGTAHDLTGSYGLTEICLPCHTPHHADDHGNSGPLWNHGDTAVSFTMYTTIGGNTGTLNGVSKLCLSCHDGVTAIDSYGGNTGSDVMTNTDTIIGAGGDLTNDHPIGIAYPATGDFVSAVSGKVGILPLYTVATIERVECASCHNPHDNANGQFLRMVNDTSQLCTTCHTK